MRISSFAGIRENWGDILAILRNNADIESHQQLEMVNNEWVLTPSERPMIEDIVCARMEEHDRLFEYLKLAGFDVGVREARVIEIDVVQKSGLGDGGSGKVER